MRKSIVTVAAIAALCAPLTACGGGSEDNPSEATPTVTETVTEAAPEPEAVEPPPAEETKADNTISDGIYLVGEDIPAGTYKTQGPESSDILDSCYFERSKNDSGDLEAILDNDNLTGPGRTTVSKGQLLTLSGGCEWTKVE